MSEQTKQGVKFYTEIVYNWCWTEQTPYSLEELGNDAWLTGCPYCGSPDCGKNASAEDIAEADEFFSSV